MSTTTELAIFAPEGGTISAWHSAVDPISALAPATLIVDNFRNAAVHKDLAFGTNKHGNFLCATNFRKPASSTSLLRPLSPQRSMEASAECAEER